MRRWFASLLEVTGTKRPLARAGLIVGVLAMSLGGVAWAVKRQAPPRPTDDQIAALLNRTEEAQSATDETGELPAEPTPADEPTPAEGPQWHDPFAARDRGAPSSEVEPAQYESPAADEAAPIPADDRYAAEGRYAADDRYATAGDEGADPYVATDEPAVADDRYAGDDRYAADPQEEPQFAAADEVAQTEDYAAGDPAEPLPGDTIGDAPPELQLVEDDDSAADRAAPYADEPTVADDEGGYEPLPAAGHSDDPYAEATLDAAPLNAGAEGTGRPGQHELEGPQMPALVLEKTAPNEVQVGRPATFQIRVRNTGQTAAHNVQIHDRIPSGMRLQATNPRAEELGQGELLWELGTLPAGGEAHVELELVAVQEGELGSVASVTFSAEASARTTATQPRLVLDVDAPAEVMVGQEVTLNIRLSNEGTGVAQNVVLSERVPAGLEHAAGVELEYDVGSLRPNESRELQLTLTAVSAGQVENLLLVKADGPLQTEAVAALEVVAPDLAVRLEGPKRRFLERRATYTVHVSNPGTAAAEEVELVTYLPPGLEFVEANNSGEYDPRTRTVHWLLEELPAGAEGSVTWTALPVEPGEQTVRVTGAARNGVSTQEQSEILIEGVAALLFEVADLADPVEVGEETTYEIRVVNQGSKAATNVQLVVELPRELEPVDADGPTRHELQDGYVQFAPLDKLAAKGEAVYHVHVRGARPGDLRVRVQLTTDDSPTPVTEEESTRVYADE